MKAYEKVNQQAQGDTANEADGVVDADFEEMDEVKEA
jgi:hypothetical protein